MKMKIIKHKFFLLMFLILLIFQPVFLLSIRLAAENRFSTTSKKEDFYNESYRSEGYETPRMIRNQNQEWNSQEANLELNNLAMNINNNNNLNNNINSNLSDISYRHNTTPMVRVNNNHINNPQQMISRMQNTVMGIDPCPCISRVKCQPCGIAPVLDFSRNNMLECPCAPKPNCPVCPPLSLIHEIASKKVKYNFK